MIKWKHKRKSQKAFKKVQAIPLDRMLIALVQLAFSIHLPLGLVGVCFRALCYWLLASQLPFAQQLKRKMSSFGHCVYKNYDPRAEEVFSAHFEKLDECIRYILDVGPVTIEVLFNRAMGFPLEFFTVLFAIPCLKKLI